MPNDMAAKTTANAGMAAKKPIIGMRLMTTFNIFLFIFGLLPLLAHDPPAKLLYGAESTAEALELNKTVAPVLTGMRDASGTFWVKKRKHQNFMLYYLLHVFPSFLWCISMPLQHVRRVRNRYLTVHKSIGTSIIVIGTVIGIAGMLFPAYDLAFSHERWSFIHKLRLGPPSRKIVVMFWPTFVLQTFSIGCVFLVASFKVLQTGWFGPRSAHTTWVTVYTYAGYAIPIHRVWTLFYMLTGAVVGALPAHVQSWLSVPTTPAGIHEAELAANAWATAMAWLSLIGILTYKLGPVRASKNKST